jgi:hypothetical protein
MSISSVSNNLAHFLPTSQNVPSKQFRQDFQQLGQDLRSGNLAGAQALFTHIPKPGHGQSSSQGGTPIEQEFGKLGQALQSGNLAAAQQDYSQIQKHIDNRVDQLNPPQVNSPAQPVAVLPPSPAKISLTA